MPITVATLILAGISLVLQNALMVRITQSVSTVLITLVINSSVGLTALLVILISRNGMAGLTEAAGAIRPWALLPGLLGSFFVFAGILGYQRLGAAPTIAVLVASQLLAGLAFDAAISGKTMAGFSMWQLVGALLLVSGAVLVAGRNA
ncbi:EamA-like transporter family protein [Rhizobium sp. P40RR-XXII]|uniref:DMT family transporter n=1 Tax=unclassified Rhizobium TaxID=2613769 RepID=UPI001456E623|nr:MULTISPECIES: DMT family transporter [unclassified Rhizobium]NLR83144.1 EamA-like transporter family protein [Rhizobium sp. P28RR-XV]NLS20824.1 EamA-like transporter family protein [Rhizobium sp. P40RR-XXII]